LKFPNLQKSVIALFVISLLTVTFSGALADSAYAAAKKPLLKSSVVQSKSSSPLNSILNRILPGKKLNGANKYPGYYPQYNQQYNQPGKSPQSALSEKPPKDYDSKTSGLTAYEQEAINLLNADRAAQGLPALKVNMDLVRLAQDYAQDMIDRGFFSHQSPEGLSPFDRMKRAGINYKWAGENLAINSSVANAQKALMNSAGHRANILNSNFTHVGIGVKRDKNGSFYVVQKFIGI
jgi:uncharacterized protein YkwD